MADVRTAGSLEPDFNLIAIRISDVRVWERWSKFATPEQPPSGALDFHDGVVDVVRVHEPKIEICHATNCAGRAGILRER
jgi:hypothetical protein